MPLHIEIYRSVFLGKNGDPIIQDCTNGGFSSTVQGVTLMNVNGPIAEPSSDYPPAWLTCSTRGGAFPKIVPANWTRAGYVETPLRFGFGGNFGFTSDQRFAEAVEHLLGFYHGGAVKIFDRTEWNPTN